MGWVGLVEETIIEIKATYEVHSSFLNEYTTFIKKKWAIPGLFLFILLF